MVPLANGAPGGIGVRSMSAAETATTPGAANASAVSIERTRGMGQGRAHIDDVDRPLERQIVDVGAAGR